MSSEVFWHVYADKQKFFLVYEKVYRTYDKSTVTVTR